VLAQAFGADTDRWQGQRVELYRDTCQFQGQITDCLRLRAAAAPAAAPAPALAVVQPQPAPAPVQPQPGTPVNPSRGGPW
jgi:hypothetical protein